MTSCTRTDLQEEPLKNRLMQAVLHLHKDEAGQGLVEYLLIIALVGFAATAGMSSLAEKLSSAFTQIGATLGSYIT